MSYKDICIYFHSIFLPALHLVFTQAIKYVPVNLRNCLYLYSLLMKSNVSNILPTIQLTSIHQHHETLPHGEEPELKERNIELFPRLKIKTFFS